MDWFYRIGISVMKKLMDINLAMHSVHKIKKTSVHRIKVRKKILIGFHVRSSHLNVFYQKYVHKNFSKFTRKHLCQSFLLNKAADWRLQLYYKETLAQVFFCEVCEIFKNSYFYGIPLVAACSVCSLTRCIPVRTNVDCIQTFKIENINLKSKSLKTLLF